MKRLLFLALLLNIFSGYTQIIGPTVPEEDVTVVLGIDKTLKFNFSPSTKVQVGDQSVLSFQIIPSKQEITLKGKKAGTTSVTLRDTKGDQRVIYKVNVRQDKLTDTVKELYEFLGHIEGLEINIKGNKVVLEGELVVPKDLGLIETVLASDSKYESVLNLIELSPHTQREIARKMQEELHKNNLKDLTVRVVNKSYWIEGQIPGGPGSGNDQLARAIVQGYMPDRIKNLGKDAKRVESFDKDPILWLYSFMPPKQEPPKKKQIKITTQFVELTRDYNKIFGFRWIPTLTGGGGSIEFGKTTDGGVTTNSSNTLNGAISNLFPKLKSAKEAGYARVIQQGMILVEDGHEEGGKISKQQQIPFSVGTGEFTKSETANLGLDVTVKPRIIDNNKVQMGIGVSVSLPGGQGSTGSPITISNNISTKVIVENKESAVIGGISINQNQTAFDKDAPGALAEDSPPALFDFKRSKSYSTNRSQFVVFLTPEIISSASEATADIRKKFRKRLR